MKFLEKEVIKGEPFFNFTKKGYINSMFLARNYIRLIM